MGKYGLSHFDYLFIVIFIAQCLVSDLGAKDLSLRRIPGLEIEFIPSTINDDNTIELFDLFIPQTGPNCPHASVRNRPNGHITGDLFEEVKPGYYLFRESVSPVRE